MGIIINRICGNCKLEKSLEDFHKCNSKNLGTHSTCKKCVQEYRKNNLDKLRKSSLDHYHNNKSKYKINQKNWIKNNYRKHKNSYLFKRFGITLELYEEMLKKQNNKCAICPNDQKDFRRAFPVDHCHKTSKIRGILCESCNTSLGKFRDSIDLLKSAIDYLKNAESTEL